MIPPERTTRYFASIDNESATLPDWFADNRNVSNDQVETFSDILDDLLVAQTAPLSVVNPHSVDGEPVKKNQRTLEDVANDDYEVEEPESERVEQWQAVIDPNRAKAAADGRDIDFILNIPTSSYEIVPPKAIYNPLLAAIRDFGLEDDVFGEVAIEDYGGNVFIRIAFPEYTLENIGEENTDIVYLCETGYDYKGSRAIFSVLSAYETEYATTLSDLGNYKYRKHTETAVQDINSWWDDNLERMDAMTDPISANIEASSNLYQEFDSFDEEVHAYEETAVPSEEIGRIEGQKPYSIYRFYEGMGLPGYACELATKYLKRKFSEAYVSLWDLYRAVQYALEYTSREIKEETRKRHGSTARGLITGPNEQMTIADKDWNIECDESTGAPGSPTDQAALDDDSALGVLAEQSGGDESLVDKQQTFRQKKQTDLKQLVEEFE